MAARGMSHGTLQEAAGTKRCPDSRHLPVT